MTTKINYRKDGVSRTLELDGRGRFVADYEIETAEVSDAFVDSALFEEARTEAYRQKYLAKLGDMLAPGASLPEFIDKLTNYLVWVRYRQAPAAEARRILLDNASHTLNLADVQVASSFLNMSVPCFFPGCEALRQEFRAALKNRGGDACSTCDRNQLETEFSIKALAAYRQASPDHERS